VLPAQVLAFGGLGHRTAGLLAEQKLCPAARSEVADPKATCSLPSRISRRRSQPHEQRSEALRFVVHFVVDVHQPVHVSRAADGGGTEVDVKIGDDVRSLHGFWDVSVFNRRGVAPERFAEELEASFEAVPAARAHDPQAEWAAESLVLRPTVYSYAPASLKSVGQ